MTTGASLTDIYLPSAAASVAKDTSILLLTTPFLKFIYLGLSPVLLHVLPKEHRDHDVILYQE